VKKKFKYLVSNDRDALWGLTVNTIGYEEIEPGDDYPTRGHADGYSFDIHKGRVLNEYQIQYIKEGEGTFHSDCIKEATLKTGDIFILFPGEWHAYHPNPNKGWKCYWIGFQGRNMDDRVRTGFLSPRKPIYHVGYSSEMVRTYDNALSVADEEAAFVQQHLAGIVNYIIGMMYSLERNMALGHDAERLELINRGRQRIRETLEGTVTIQEISEELGVSYSNFRKLFKEFTGISPSTYQQDLKLQRAKDLLSTTDKSIKEIAYQLNFENPDYFSAKFRLKTGVKPSQFRKESI
jgi:AraC-like DNA-binding protein